MRCLTSSQCVGSIRGGLDRGRLTVQRSYHPENGFSTTKNDKIRELLLTWDAIDALHVERSRANGELVFPGEDGEVMV